MDSPAPSTPASNKLPSIGQLLSDSLNTYQGSWKLFVLIVLLPILATIVVIALVGIIIATVLSVTGGQVTPNRLPLLIPPALVAIVALAIINAMGKIALIKTIQLKGNSSIKDLIQSSWPLVGRYVVLQILVGLTILLGFVLLVIPGILFMIWFLFASIILVVEGISGTAAMKRSKFYVRGKFWGVLGRMAILLLIIGLITGVSSAVDSQVVNIVFQVIATFVIGPIATIYIFRLYEGVKATA